MGLGSVPAQNRAPGAKGFESSRLNLMSARTSLAQLRNLLIYAASNFYPLRNLLGGLEACKMAPSTSPRGKSSALSVRTAPAVEWLQPHQRSAESHFRLNATS